jgi:hypothetical protein
MKKKIIALFMAAMALMSLFGCKSGCNCHGDPYGNQMETYDIDKA